jgi:hypothetical protein
MKNGNTLLYCFVYIITMLLAGGIGYNLSKINLTSYSKEVEEKQSHDEVKHKPNPVLDIDMQSEFWIEYIELDSDQYAVEFNRKVDENGKETISNGEVFFFDRRWNFSSKSYSSSFLKSHGVITASVVDGVLTLTNEKDKILLAMTEEPFYLHFGGVNKVVVDPSLKNQVLDLAYEKIKTLRENSRWTR